MKKPKAKKVAKPAKKKPVKIIAKIKKTAVKLAKVALKAKAPAPVKEAKKPVKPEVKTKPIKPEPAVEKPLKKAKPVEVDAEELKTTADSDAEVVLTDAEGRRYCRVQDCDQVAVVDAYCRFHYLLYWKKIQYRKKILADDKFEKYIEELTSKYPDKFLDVIRRDLSNQKNFISAIQEMELDESDPDTAQDLDDAKSYLDEVRGVGGEISEASEDDF